MTQQQEQALYVVLRVAVQEAIDVIGIAGVREMSMFPSSKWNAKNDNALQLALAKAA